MVPILMKAGDAILFTENLRHGGFRNTIDSPRRTIHFCFQQIWAGSQSPAHINGPMRFTSKAWASFSDEQRKLFAPVDLID